MKLLIKLFGILSVILSVSLFGFFKTHSKKAYIERLQKISAAFSGVDAALRLSPDSRDRILNSAFGGIEGFSLSGGKHCFLDKCMPDKLSHGINTFLSEFGSGDIPLERQRIKRVLYEIDSETNKEKAAYAGSYKLWQTVSVCAGLGLGIMLI